MFTYAKDRVDDLCQSRGQREDTGDFAQEFLRSSVSGFLDVGCRRLNSSEKCRQEEPEAMQVLDRLMASRVPAQKYSPVFPLVEISRRLESPH